METVAHKTNAAALADYKSLNTGSNNTSLIKARNPISQAVANMLHRDASSNYYDVIPDAGVLGNISNTIADRVEVYKNIFQQLPDIEAAIDIRVSMILSPNDLLTTSLYYSSLSKILPPGLVNILLEVIKETFDGNEYDFKHYLKYIVKDVLGLVGSYALAIIPEPAIGDIINDTNKLAIESIINKGPYNPVYKSGRIFAKEGYVDQTNGTIKYEDGTTKPISGQNLFNYTINEDINTITKGFTHIINRNILDKNSGRRAMATEDMNEDLSSLLKPRPDDKKTLNRSEFLKVKNDLFQRKPNAHHRVIQLNDTDWATRPAIGHPLTFHYPSKCVIPLHMPGDPMNHIGFLVLTDKYSQPITDVRESSMLDAFYNNTGTNKIGGSYSSVLGALGRYGTGVDCDYGDKIDSTQLLNFAKRIIEDDVTYRLYKGTYDSSSLKVSCPENVALIMLSYRLMDLDVTMQFIPGTLMTYFVTEVDSLGIGIPLTDKVKYVASLRSALQFANTVAGIKNSIGVTKLDVTVDSADPNLKQTVEQLVTRIQERRSMLPVINNSSPITLDKFMSSATMQCKVSSEEGKMDSGIDPIPATAVEVTEMTPNYPGVDENLMEKLTVQSHIGVGVPSNIVQGSMEDNFAVEVIYNSQMLIRRILDDKLKIDKGITSHVKQFAYNSGIIMSRLTKAIKENIEMVHPLVEDGTLKTINDVITEFLDNIKVTLPEPNTTKYKDQLDLLDKYIDLLDKAIEVYLKGGVYTRLFESLQTSDEKNDASFNEETFIGIIRNNLINTFMVQNNILPELRSVFDLTGEDINLQSLLDESMGDAGEIINVYNNAKKTFLSLLKSVNDANKNIPEKLLVTTVDSMGGYGEPDSPSSKLSDDGSTDDFGISSSTDTTEGTTDEDNMGFEKFKDNFRQNRKK